MNYSCSRNFRWWIVWCDFNHDSTSAITIDRDSNQQRVHETGSEVKIYDFNVDLWLFKHCDKSYFFRKRKSNIFSTKFFAMAKGNLHFRSYDRFWKTKEHFFPFHFPPKADPIRFIRVRRKRVWKMASQPKNYCHFYFSRQLNIANVIVNSNFSLVLKKDVNILETKSIMKPVSSRCVGGWL